MRVTATEAKNRFGALCLQAKEAPVVVEKAGQPDTVLLSYSDYQRLTAEPSARARRQQFSARFAEWIAAQNAEVDAHGVWSDGLRAW
jgi:prevent-host-death family protein